MLLLPLFFQLAGSVQWKYLMNVAGEAFPLKTNAELVGILRLYNGASDVEGIYWARVHKSRFKQEWKEMQGEDGKRVVSDTYI